MLDVPSFSPALVFCLIPLVPAAPAMWVLHTAWTRRSQLNLVRKLVAAYILAIFGYGLPAAALGAHMVYRGIREQGTVETPMLIAEGMSIVLNCSFLILFGIPAVVGLALFMPKGETPRPFRQV